MTDSLYESMSSWIDSYFFTPIREGAAEDESSECTGQAFAHWCSTISSSARYCQAYAVPSSPMKGVRDLLMLPHNRHSVISELLPLECRAMVIIAVLSVRTSLISQFRWVRVDWLTCPHGVSIIMVVSYSLLLRHCWKSDATMNSEMVASCSFFSAQFGTLLCKLSPTEPWFSTQHPSVMHGASAFSKRWWEVVEE